MRYIKADVKANPKNLHVLLLNDLHFGSEAVDYGLLERIFQYINKNRDSVRILINGDIIEGITKNSKGDIHKQRLSPSEQVDLAVEYFKPYTDLIDCVTTGNHDFRTTDESSFDPVEIFCKDLGIKHKYAGYEAVVGFSWNKMHYSIEMYHGTGGGSTTGAIENFMKRSRKTTADVYYVGHFHKEMAKPFIEWDIDKYNQKVRRTKKWLICGNTLTNTAEYAIKYRYQEGLPSQCVLTLSGNRDKREIEVNWIR